LEHLIGMIPGMGHLKNADGVDEKQLVRVEAIISSMTSQERRNHQVINGSRRKRIARGSGTSVEDVNRLLKQFVQMRKMLKVVGGMSGGRAGRNPMAMRKQLNQLRSMLRG
ncbi:MAG: signal recognition particle protein, partial [Vicinamibacterales bacterium]